MYRIEGFNKRDPYLRWTLTDRIFFACGACYILAYAFFEKHEDLPLRARWLKPDAGFTGNHIYVASEGRVFDCHGYSEPERYFRHVVGKARPPPPASPELPNAEPTIPVQAP